MRISMHRPVWLGSCLQISILSVSIKSRIFCYDITEKKIFKHIESFLVKRYKVIINVENIKVNVSYKSN